MRHSPLLNTEKRLSFSLQSLLHGLFIAALTSTTVLISHPLSAETAYLPNQVNYGRVISHKRHEIDPTYARGALLGAISGAIIADNDPGWGALGGALVGGGLEAAITSGQSTYKVVVRLTNGQSFAIATPPNEVRTGDCVAVEYTGEGTELYKVSHEFCGKSHEKKNQPPSETDAQPEPYRSPSYDSSSNSESSQSGHRQAKAQRCDAARSRLQQADDDSYQRVLSDVQRYCQD